MNIHTTSTYKGLDGVRTVDVDDLIRRMQKTYFISEVIHSCEAEGRGATLREVVEGARERAERQRLHFSNLDITYHLDMLEQDGRRLHFVNGQYRLTEHGREDFININVQMAALLAGPKERAKVIGRHRNDYGD